MSPAKRTVQADLARLLDRLERKAEEGFARVHLRGRAVSKSADNLHLSVPMGIVAIPLADIERVDPISGDDSTLVGVTVRNGDRIKPLVTASWPTLPERRPRLPLGGLVGPGPLGIPTEICKFTYKEVCTDTATMGVGALGGPAAGKDDTVCGLELTDENCKND